MDTYRAESTEDIFDDIFSIFFFFEKWKSLQVQSGRMLKSRKTNWFEERAGDEYQISKVILNTGRVALAKTTRSCSGCSNCYIGPISF